MPSGGCTAYPTPYPYPYPYRSLLSKVVKYGDAGEVGQDTLHRNIVAALGPEATKAADLAVELLQVRVRVRVRP